MKLALAIAALALFAIPAHADTVPNVDYTYTVTNAPGSIGSFSWEIQTTGFIEPPPDPVYQCIEYCNESSEHWIRQCVEYCGNVDLFTSFMSESAPSNGGGCQIIGAWLIPDYSITTEFSPVCSGMYDGESAGTMPDPGTLGTWNWSWGSGADETYASLTVSDPSNAPVGIPEPHSLFLLSCGLGTLWMARKVRRSSRALESTGVTL